MMNFWRRAWGGKTPSLLLVMICAAVALLMAIPLFYIFYRAGLGGAEVWSRLLSARLPRLFTNTMGLTAVVTFSAVVLGVSLAWLVEKTDLPGRNIWRWVLALPLAIPPYVGGIAYITIFGPRGIFEEQVERFFGAAAASALPSIFGFPGAAIILILFTYPYVYLLTAAALRSFNVSLEDAGRSLGEGTWGVFRRVTFPLMRPAIGAGALLVGLYVISDFGAVALMRFDTFTLAIYQELTTRFSRESAAALSAILVLITFVILWGETKLHGKAKYYQTGGTWRPANLIVLGKYRPVALAYSGLVAFFALFAPVALLAYWTVRGLADQPLDSAFLSYVGNSFGLSAVAATTAVLIGLPVAFLAARHPGLLSRQLARLSQAGYALPGVVVALSVVFIFVRFFPGLYGTAAVLIAAYVIRFLPQSLRGAASGLSQISPNLEDASRNLGRSPLRTLIEVTGPLILPSLVAGWALVFISTLKELPATLILRPPGFDTLPVRLWTEASEGFYTLAAPPALVLVLVSVVALYLLLTKSRSGIAEAS